MPPPAPFEFDVIVDGKAARFLEKRNIAIHDHSYEEFTEILQDIACMKGKISPDDYEDFETNISWIWISVAKSQAKNLPRFNGLENRDNFAQIQSDIETHFRAKKHLNNMVLRIKIELSKGSFDPIEERSRGGRPVSTSATPSNCRPLPSPSWPPFAL
jgi:hypothetical protein